MAVSPQTQFYKALIKIGGVFYPLLPQVGLSQPENYAVPPIIGNYWQFSFGQGFINPTLDVSFVVRDVTNEVMALAFWQLLLGRSNDAAHDTTALTGGIDVWDGRSGFNMAGAKFDSVSISCAKGGDITISARFVGSHLSALSSAPTGFTGWSNANVLRFKNLVFTSPLNDQVWNFALSFSNNHTPDMSLDGSEYPAAQNAGMMSCGVNLTTQAAYLTPPDNGTFPVPSTLAVIEFSIVGSSATRTFTMPNPIDSTKRNREIATGRVMRQHSYIALGGDSQTNGPLTVT